MLFVGAGAAMALYLVGEFKDSWVLRLTGVAAGVVTAAYGIAEAPPSVTIVANPSTASPETVVIDTPGAKVQLPARVAIGALKILNR